MPIIPTNRGAPQGTDVAIETVLPTIGNSSRQDLQDTLSFADTELNKLFGDRNAHLADGGFITFTGTQLQFTQNLNLVINSNANTPSNPNNPPIVINLGSSSVTLSTNGDMWYAVVNRATAMATTATVSAATGLPTVKAANIEVFLLAKRFDSADGTQIVYFRDGSAVASGDTLRLGKGPIIAAHSSISSGMTSTTVTFAVARSSSTYAVLTQMVNTTDTNPQFQPTVVTNKTTSGFTVKWNVPTDSANYVLDYYVTSYT